MAAYGSRKEETGVVASDLYPDQVLAVAPPHSLVLPALSAGRQT